MTEAAILDVHKVTFAYERGAPVLLDFDLHLASGEVVGLLGRNGAGKSTLMNLLMGLLHPQTGQVTLFGMDPVREPVAVKRRIGYVPDDVDLPPHLSIDALLRLHRELFPTWDLELEAELRQRFRLSKLRRVGNLSKGEARQVALTCAMAHRPELLLLDEPGSSIDPVMRREFLAATLSVLKRGETTVLFSSHHVHDVERIADRVVLLDDGRALLDAPLDQLKEGLTLAVIPADARGQRAIALHGDAACVRVRKRGAALHAILRAPAAQARAHLQTKHGITDAECGPAPALEDLFVELVGRES